MNDQNFELKRIDEGDLLPTVFKQLSKDEQHEIILKLTEQDLELRHELLRKVNQSKVAEHDLAVVAEEVARLDHERKIYSVNHNVETGSGQVDIKIRGGDVKFITPILLILVILILGLMAILFL